MEKVNREIIKILEGLYNEFPESKDIDVRRSSLTEKQVIGLIRFLNDEGFIKASGNPPVFNLSLTGKGYQFIHSILQKQGKAKELLIIY